MARTNPAEYVRQVRQEVSKVTWPTRKETGITTAMVFVFVTIMALFFLVVDQVSAVAIQFILGVGG
ncbi:preprotein translocase subunit SecE [Fodinicurvata sp. EGI_FJ10296]|uniref:preprotein translocase subunit SecE n=1 Tax=Fodinicurvata sp. EGI_FJ10296 TaxID=3231908 RepID=UPI003452E01F